MRISQHTYWQALKRTLAFGEHSEVVLKPREISKFPKECLNFDQPGAVRERF